MQKRLDIELLRVLSAFAIVWYHAQSPGGPVAYGGLIVFVVLSLYLGGEKRLSAETVLQRTQRILVPWAVWFVVYALVNIFIHKRAVIPTSGGLVAGVLSGPRIHLWYMPFIFGCLVAFDAARTVASRRALGWGSAAIYIGIVLATPWWRPISLTVPTPAPQYAHAAAGVFLGVFLANSGALTQGVKLLAVAAMALATLAAWHHIDVVVPYLIGLAIGCMLIFNWSRRFNVDVSAWSNLALGIYFIHPLFLTLFERITPRGTYSLAVIAIAASTATVWAARRAAPRFARYWS